MRQPWEWRKAEWGVCLRTDLSAGELVRLFHAYDVNNLAACEPCGLIGSCEIPNEGSSLCPDCVLVVQDTPEGRPERIPA